MLKSTLSAPLYALRFMMSCRPVAICAANTGKYATKLRTHYGCRTAAAGRA